MKYKNFLKAITTVLLILFLVASAAKSSSMSVNSINVPVKYEETDMIVDGEISEFDTAGSVAVTLSFDVGATKYNASVYFLHNSTHLHVAFKIEALGTEENFTAGIIIDNDGNGALSNGDDVAIAFGMRGEPVYIGGGDYYYSSNALQADSTNDVIAGGHMQVDTMGLEIVKEENKADANDGFSIDVNGTLNVLLFFNQSDHVTDPTKWIISSDSYLLKFEPPQYPVIGFVDPETLEPVSNGTEINGTYNITVAVKKTTINKVELKIDNNVTNITNNKILNSNNVTHDFFYYTLNTSNFDNGNLTVILTVYKVSGLNSSLAIIYVVNNTLPEEGGGIPAPGALEFAITMTLMALYATRKRKPRSKNK